VGLLNACVDVVALIEVDVLKEVATNGFSGDRVTVHLDSWEMGYRSFHRHQTLA
jgi:hypothetical protein